MFILKLDFGALILLYFIFRGIRNSQKAKKNYRDRKTNEATKKERASRPTVVQTKRKQKEVVLERPIQSKVKPEVIEKSIRHVLPSQDSIATNKAQPKVKGPAKTKPAEKQLVVENNDNDYQPLELGEVVNGMIWAEILNPPKAKRRKTLH